MRFNLLSLFLGMTIAALLVALYAERQRPDVVRIGDYVDTWEMEKSILCDSKWADKRNPPELTASEVYSIGSSVCQQLDSKADQTRVKDWEVTAVSLEKTQFSNREHWVYIVRVEGRHTGNMGCCREPERLGLMVLMDKSIIFDFKNYPDPISQAMKGLGAIRIAKYAR